MKRAMHLVALACMVSAGASLADETQRPAAVSLDLGSHGFIDIIRLGSRELVKAEKDFVGASVALTPAGDGTAGSLFTNAAAEILAAHIDGIQASADGTVFTVRGSYAGTRHRVPFGRTLTVDAANQTIEVEEATDFSQLDPAVLVSRYVLRLPLACGTNEHDRMFGFGGARRAELFRMDMNDIARRDQNISAPRGHWPYWDIGGVQYVADSYQIWKANHADTPAYPLEEGTNGPGWADYSERDAGLTVAVTAPVQSAPWSITINARAGVVSIAPFPPSQMPAAGRSLGVRRFHFRLLAHEGSWPATAPCELPFPTYEAFLASIPYYQLAWAVGTSDIPTVIRRERVQPSVILRLLYRGDAWQMTGRMKTIGINRPRYQSWEQWEADAHLYLAYLRTNGLPRTTTK